MNEEPQTEPTAAEPLDPQPTDSEPTAPVPPARSGVFVPRWFLLTVSGLLVLGLGFASGYAVGTDSDHDDRRGEHSFDLRGLRPFLGGNGSPFAPAPRDGNRGGSGGNGSGPRTAPTAGVFLGVEVQDSTEPPGAKLVRVVPSSPAARAGLRMGDVVTTLDSTSVKDAAQLTKEVRGHRPGDRVSVTFVRNGSSKTVSVRLVARPSAPETSQQ